MLLRSDRRSIIGLTLALIGSVSVAPRVSATTWKPAHVVVVIEENHTREQVLPDKPNQNTPYIRKLADEGALFTDAHGVTHPSQLNYFALFAGTTLGFDCEYDKYGSLSHCLGLDGPLKYDAYHKKFAPKTLPNLAAALTAKGYSFAGFSEDIPEAGSLNWSSPKGYARKHNPWSNWQSDADGPNLLKRSINRSFDSFPRTPEKFSTDLPTVAFVVPNVYNDEHGAPHDDKDALLLKKKFKDWEQRYDALLLKKSNDWLQTYIEPFATWAKDNDSLLIVTWDEGYGKDKHNSIPLILYGAGVKKGRYSQKVTHYHVLRLIEDLYGLDPTGESAKVDPIRDVIP
jgi:hypothetical protein